MLKHIILSGWTNARFLADVRGEWHLQSPHRNRTCQRKQLKKAILCALFSFWETPTPNSILIHYQQPPGISYHHLKHTVQTTHCLEHCEKDKGRGKRTSSAKTQTRNNSSKFKRDPVASSDCFQVLWHYLNIFDDSCPELIGCTNTWPSRAKHTCQTSIPWLSTVRQFTEICRWTRCTWSAWSQRFESGDKSQEK